MKKTLPSARLKLLPEDRQLEVAEFGRAHTLAETRAWLAEQHGIHCGLTAVQEFLAGWRDRAAQERILGSIASGATLVRDMERKFAQDPAPTNDALLKLFRVLVMQLAATGSCDPEFLKTAGAMMSTVLEAERLDLKRAEVALAREKFQRDTCELYLKWAADQRAKAVVEDAAITQAEKIEKLGQMMFGEDWK